MNFTEYQEKAQRTARKDMELEKRLAVAGLGIVGEAGEVAEVIKKHIGHGHMLDKPKLVSELGDVLWYISEITSLLDLELDKVALNNIDKLKARYPKGFEAEKSINRG